MIETLRAQLVNPRVRVSYPLPLAWHLHEGQEVLKMHTPLNADRGTIVAEVSHMVRAGELTKGPEPHTLSASE